MTQISVLPLPAGLPTYNSALTVLERVPDILYRGLEYGAFKTSSFRDAEFPKKRLDACLSASIFRAHAIDFLKREGIDAQADGFKWTFNDLPFMGISFYYNEFHIRILKGTEFCVAGVRQVRKKEKVLRSTAE